MRLNTLTSVAGRWVTQVMIQSSQGEDFPANQVYICIYPLSPSQRYDAQTSYTCLQEWYKEMHIPGHLTEDESVGLVRGARSLHFQQRAQVILILMGPDSQGKGKRVDLWVFHLFNCNSFTFLSTLHIEALDKCTLEQTVS